MNVKIFTFKNGVERIENVTTIRIKSKDYNLLILKDYLSIIGEIDGEIEFEIKDSTDKIKYEGIKAYYINNDNEFTLMLEGE